MCSPFFRTFTVNSTSTADCWGVRYEEAELLHSYVSVREIATSIVLDDGDIVVVLLHSYVSVRGIATSAIHGRQRPCYCTHTHVSAER